MIEAFQEIRFRPATLDLIGNINTIIGNYQALGFTLTLRQLFYQFVSHRTFGRTFANTFENYKRLGRTVTDARRSRPDRLGRDRGPAPCNDAAPADLERSGRDHQQLAHRNIVRTSGASQHYRPESWIEKDALTGVIEGVCKELRVPYFSCRGNVSEPEMYAAGKRFADVIDQGQVPLVLHLGDHDPNGLDMTRDIRERLAMFAGQEIEVRRIALNIDQTTGLPPNFAKEKDSRYADYVRRFGRHCWELDALAPNVISGLLRTELEGLINQNAWNEALVDEEDNRSSLTSASDNWALVKSTLERRRR